MIKNFLFIILLLSINLNSFAEVFFSIPNNIELEEMNKGMKKTRNRYTSFDQINNQYKGKLKYKPSESMYRNDRYGRYYTSVSVMFNKNNFNKFEENNTTNNLNIYNTKFKNTISAEFGRYLLNNLYLSLEYFEYNTNNVIVIVPNSYKNLKFNYKGRAYLLNLSLENNYLRFIPFFGVGFGLLLNNFSISDNKVTIKDVNLKDIIYSDYYNISKTKPIRIYQIFAGIEFAVSENMFIVLKYKHFNMIDKITMKMSSKSIQEKEYNLNLAKNNNSFTIGFKYLW